jgi:3-hydroxyacyl-CoA dehydrogenase/3-hydroxy-2-methylbutyryl-CoA dehydrogenase
MDVQGSVAVVSGGASGLGAGVVRMLVAGGGRVACIDRDEEAGRALVEEVGSACTFHAADITDPDQVTEACAAAVDAHGEPNLLVNCAGIAPVQRLLGRDGTVYPLEQFRTVMEVNVIGTFDVIRNVAPRMAARQPGADGERGLIVNTGSLAGLEGQAGQTGYGASKGAVVALTLPLARDLAPLGIRVLCICPAAMDTPMVHAYPEEAQARLSTLHLFPKRLGTAQDFAALVRSTMEQPMLNGSVIRLDAGTHLGG